MADATVSLLLEATDKASPVVRKLDRALQRLAKTAGHVDASKITAAFDRLSRGSVGKLVTGFTRGFDTITKAAAKLPSKIMSGLGRVVSYVPRIAQGIARAFTAGFRTIVQAAAKLSSKMMAGLGKLVSFVPTIAGAMLRGFTSAFTMIVGGAMKLATGILNAIGGAVRRVVDLAAGIAVGMVKAFAGVVSKIVGLFGGLAQKVGGALGKVGLSMAKLYAGQMKKGIWDLADIESYRTTLEIVTKDTQRAADVVEYARKRSSKTPFDSKPMIEAASSLERYGLKTEKWLTRVADVASTFRGTSMKDVTGALGSLKAGRTDEGLQQVQSWDIGRTDLEGAGLEFDKEGKLVSSAEQAMEAVAQIMDQKFGGAAQKQANTFHGLVSTLKGYWTDFRNTIAQPIFDRFREGLTQLRDRWEAFRGTVNYKELVKGFQDLGATIADKAVSGISAMASALTQIDWGNVSDLGRSIMASVAEAVDFIMRINLGAVGQKLVNSFADAGTSILGVFDEIQFVAFSFVADLTLRFGRMAQEVSMMLLKMLAPLEQIPGIGKWATAAADRLGTAAAAIGKQSKQAAGGIMEGSYATSGLVGTAESRLRGLKRDPGALVAEKGEGGTLGKLVDVLPDKLADKAATQPTERDRVRAEIMQDAQAGTAGLPNPDDAYDSRGLLKDEYVIKKQEDAADKLDKAGNRLDAAAGKLDKGSGRLGSAAARATKGYQLPKSKKAQKFEGAVQKQLGRLEKGHFSQPGFGGRPNAAYREARKRFGGAVAQQRQGRAQSKIDAIRQGEGESAKWSPEKREKQMQKWGQWGYGKKGWQDRKDQGVGGQGGQGAGGQGGGFEQLGTAAQGAEQSASEMTSAMQGLVGTATASLGGLRGELDGMKEEITNLQTTLNTIINKKEN